MITMMRGDTRPDLAIYLYENSGCCPIDLSSMDTTVQVKFREKGEDTNIFSVYAKKITSIPGVALLEWPLFGTDVEAGRYELEFTVNYGNKWITAQSFLPVKIVDTFGDISYISDSENALYRDGNLYIRNVDTNKVHLLSMIGESPSTLQLAQGNNSLMFERINSDYDDVETVFLRIFNGLLYMKSQDADNETWRQLTLIGNPVSTFQLSDKVLHFSMGSSYTPEDIQVKIVDGKFYMKNLDTLVFHEVRVRGTDTSTIEVV